MPGTSRYSHTDIHTYLHICSRPRRRPLITCLAIPSARPRARGRQRGRAIAQAGTVVVGNLQLLGGVVRPMGANDGIYGENKASVVWIDRFVQCVPAHPPALMRDAVTS